MFTQHAEHLLPAGGPGMLSLEGLNRLARHVIGNYVARAPTDLDTSFDYRDRLPGVLRMQLAVQYWLGNPAGISQSTAAVVLEGLVEVLVDVLAGRDGAALPDMRGALARIEAVVPGRDQQAGTAELVAVYLLWHAVMAPEYHRPSAAAFLDRYERLLEAPTMTAFVLRALEAEPKPWPADDLAALAAQRLDQRRRGKAQPLPVVFDAALHLTAATALAAAGRQEEALEAAARAVEEMPGDARLMDYEQTLRRGAKATIDLRALVLGLPQDASDDDDPDSTADGDGPNDASTVDPGSALHDGAGPDGP